MRGLWHVDPKLPTLLACHAPSASPHALFSTLAPPADHFHWVSFLCFSASVLFEGLRVVLTEKLMGPAVVPPAGSGGGQAVAVVRYNPIEALIYLGPFTFVALAGGAARYEWSQGLSTQVIARLPACPPAAARPPLPPAAAAGFSCRNCAACPACAPTQVTRRRASPRSRACRAWS